jgi:molecular chaperone DnaJ
MTAAALGATIDLETLDGSEPFEVRAGTQPGQVFTIRGKGVPHLRGHGRGDLHVHLDVRTPIRLDARQEELLRELAAIRDEENPSGQGDATDSNGGLFSRLRDAFSGR